MARDLKIRVEFTRSGFVRALAGALVCLLPLSLDSQNVGQVQLTTYLPIQPMGAFGALTVAGRDTAGNPIPTLLSRDGSSTGAGVLIGNTGTPGTNVPSANLAVVGAATLGANAIPGATLMLNNNGGAGIGSGVVLGDRTVGDTSFGGTYWDMHAETFGFPENFSTDPTLWFWNNGPGIVSPTYGSTSGRVLGIDGFNGVPRLCTWEVTGYCPFGAAPLYTAHFGWWGDNYYWPWLAQFYGYCSPDPNHIEDYEDCGQGLAVQLCCTVLP